MCGITGIYLFNKEAVSFENQVKNANRAMAHRGPDNQGVFFDKKIGLGHVRLSIIDTSAGAHQPFTEENERYTIVFNGEIFNFKDIRKDLIEKGHHFKTNSDTEVVLKSYIEYGETVISRFNGFFAFAIYDALTEELFIARDRMGIKPLLIYRDKDKIVFASEMKALLEYQIPKDIDNTTLYQYFQLNYVPSPWTIFKGVEKMEPGSWMRCKADKVEKGFYYELPKFSSAKAPQSYEDAQKTLYKLLDEAVERRLIADVPLGSFLSGGIDSSIISALAIRHSPNLNTFSIGYADEPLFDETHYAEMVAKKIGSNHHVFKLNNNDLYSVLFRVLDSIDEPFADSSALAVNILSYYTKQHVTVALSGDGADEMFSGYNKHSAELKAGQKSILNSLVAMGTPIWSVLPQSRNGKFSNLARQLHRFGEGIKLTPSERYWRWASISSEDEVQNLLLVKPNNEEYFERKSKILSHISKNSNINDVLYTDLKLVLQGDMLTKVDLMSMNHALEIRTPFLDYTVVDFANSLPVSYKINSKIRKKILQDTFRSILPEELFNRPKHGFEVPLLGWFRNELKEKIMQDLLHPDFIREQKIFNPSIIENLLQKLFSANPGDAAAKIWALIVFQYWWEKYYL
jgi:asparagine synthase (glutamine-hydrolysing)